MANLIRFNSGGQGSVVKDKVGSPSTGSEDGNEQDTPVNQRRDHDEPDLGDSAPHAPPEAQWYHGRLDR